MGGLPVAVNKNITESMSQLPVASTTGKPGSLGGIKADGSTIVVDQTTGVASAPAGGGTVTGSGTPTMIPQWVTTTELGDTPGGYNNGDWPDSFFFNAPFAVEDATGANGSSLELDPQLPAQTDNYSVIYMSMGILPDASMPELIGLEIDMSSETGNPTGTSFTAAINIDDTLLAGDTSYAIKSDSLAQSLFNGDVIVNGNESAAVVLQNGSIVLRMFADGSGVIQFFDPTSGANAMAFKIAADVPVAGKPSVLMNLLTLEGFSADPATAGLDEGTMWYDSTNHVLKYWNGTDIKTVATV